jgi:hypothetical protein
MEGFIFRADFEINFRETLGRSYWKLSANSTSILNISNRT